MSLETELNTEVKNIIKTTWTERDGQIVPKSEDVKLLNEGVKIEATMLYSDLVDSTELTMKNTFKFSAEVYKCFLSCSSRIIKNWDGFIRSFDGDRVMGVFIGNQKNSNAVWAALEISWAVFDIMIPEIKRFYKGTHDSFNISHCTGIDTSNLFIIRGGVRNDNDLVWIGRAANVAAKLSSIRDWNTTYITEAVYNTMFDDRKYLNDIYDGYKRKYIWVERTWNEVSGVNKIYGTNWRKIVE
jgi:class 3 adenylate cyclase